MQNLLDFANTMKRLQDELFAANWHVQELDRESFERARDEANQEVQELIDLGFTQIAAAVVRQLQFLDDELMSLE